MAEEFLYVADVCSLVEEVGGEGVAQGVGMDGLLDAGFLSCLCEYQLGRVNA